MYCVFSGYIAWNHHKVISKNTLRQLTGLKELQSNNYFWVMDYLYTPKWARNFDYLKNPKENEFDFSGKDINVTPIKLDSIFREFEIVSKTESVVNFRSFWFPGWHVYVNDNEVYTHIKSDDGTILFSVPAGISNVKVIFKNTQLRDISSIISLIGLALVVVIFLISRNRLV